MTTRLLPPVSARWLKELALDAYCLAANPGDHAYFTGLLARLLAADTSAARSAVMCSVLASLRGAGNGLTVANLLSKEQLETLWLVSRALDHSGPPPEKEDPIDAFYRARFKALRERVNAPTKRSSSGRPQAPRKHHRQR